MKMTIEWVPPKMEWDSYKCKEVPSKPDRENIYLEVGIKGLSENGSDKFFDDLEEAINKELREIYGESSFCRCSNYGESEDGVLYDAIGWKRDFGNVAEQKREIVKVFRNSYKQLREKYV